MSRSPVRALAVAVGVALGLSLGALAVKVHADPTESMSTSAGEAADPDYETGKAAVAAADWKSAIAALGRAAARTPGNADVHNLLGFSHRKAGDLDAAFKHYAEALRLQPEHRGAHEYVGEAYLMRGELEKARAHLATLDRICRFGCDEYRALKRAVADYEAKSKR